MALELLGLPVELATHILALLSFNDLLVCNRVCKYLKHAVQNSARLQYKVDLAYHNLVASEADTQESYASRRKRLLARHSAWDTLKWIRHDSVECPHPALMYDFVDGIYAVGHDAQEERRYAEGIIFYRLPTLELWKHELGMIVLDFTIDPAQDLLVLLSFAPRDSIPFTLYHIHLRTLSTNEPHPCAASPILPFARTEQIPVVTFMLMPTYRLRIQNDLVACLVRDAPHGIGSFFEIWNWRSSGPSSSRSISRQTGIEDIALLTPTTVLLMDPKGTLETWSFTDPADSSSANDTPIHKATFHLPAMRDDHRYWYNTLNVNPSPGHIPPPTADRAWFPNPEERIVVCALGTTNPASHVGPDATHSFDCFVFFTPMRTFLEPRALTPASVPWGKWSSQTRWFKDSLNTNWQHAIYGYRTVEWIPADVPPSDGKRRLRIRDFNPNIKEGVVTEPSIVPASHVFVADIESSLAYKETLSDVFEDAVGVREVMVDESTALLLKDDGFDILRFE